MVHLLFKCNVMFFQQAVASRYIVSNVKREIDKRKSEQAEVLPEAKVHLANG